MNTILLFESVIHLLEKLLHRTSIPWNEPIQVKSFSPFPAISLVDFPLYLIFGMT